MKRVFAVIVTFNRSDALQKCLATLWSQRHDGLSRIHVVVNSNDTATLQVLKSFDNASNFLTYHHYENVGPAGGFYYGLKSFLEDNCDYAWLMDDDVTIESGCLLELIKCSEKHEYVLPKVIKGDGQEIVSFGWWGAFVSRDLVIRAGLPIPELFFWAEDTEYLQNRLMRVCGIQPFRCRTAVVNHLHARKKKRPSWYYYYTLRNTLYYRTYVVGYTWPRTKRTLYLLLQSIFMIIVKEDNKIRKFKLMLLGIYHGIMGKIGKLIDPALYK